MLAPYTGKPPDTKYQAPGWLAPLGIQWGCPIYGLDLCPQMRSHSCGARREVVREKLRPVQQPSSEKEPIAC